jgi:hypothetical protein
VTSWVCEKINPNVANSFIVKMFASLLQWKKVDKNLSYSCNFQKTAQSKQPPNLVTLSDDKQSTFGRHRQDERLHDNPPNRKPFPY